MKLTAIDPLFKGCTRPAMLLGVPLVPLVLVSMLLLLIGIWSFMLVPVFGLFMIAVILPASIGWMRHVTKKDDFRLEQLLLRFSLRSRQRNTLHWGKGVAAYSPTEYRKRWQ